MGNGCWIHLEDGERKINSDASKKLQSKEQAAKRGRYGTPDTSNALNLTTNCSPAYKVQQPQRIELYCNTFCRPLISQREQVHLSSSGISFIT